MAHTLKIAGATYSDVAKVTFIDTDGTTAHNYLDADEVYTKAQAAQLIENERNKTREYTVTTADQGITFWEGDEADITYDSTAPTTDTYKLWIELK